MTISPVVLHETTAPRLSADERWSALRTVSRADLFYRIVLTVLALSLPLLLLTISGELLVGAWPAIRRFGFGFFARSAWDPVAGDFGALPLIVGTLYSSLVAIVIAVPLALGVSIFLTEFAPRRLRRPVATLVELLATIPSVIYGLWGIFVLIPLLRDVVWPVVRPIVGWMPMFRGTFYGPSVLAGGVILAIMILPYIAAVSREVLLAVPPAQREAALALGATRWEAVWTVILPYGRAGILGAVILGLGRALGETMAVTMLIGNTHEISVSLVQPGYTIASAIANEFAEAVSQLHLAALFYVGLVLFLITVIVNALARVLIWRVARGSAAGSSAV
ncbi:MAG: phosphate ABC transporter permease subunit PstC [Gemmatimonadales bacterium]|nr:phosphate ABC transporter permease subunit PstC [Gemmatimonadales bacterium]